MRLLVITGNLCSSIAPLASYKHLARNGQDLIDYGSVPLEDEAPYLISMTPNVQEIQVDPGMGDLLMLPILHL